MQDPLQTLFENLLSIFGRGMVFYVEIPIILVFLYLLRNHRKLLKLNKQKIILLIIFSLFFPSLWILLVINGFLPAFFQLIVPFSFGFREAVLTNWDISFTILALFAILLNFFTAVILNYLIICFLYKYIRNRNFLWAIGVMLVLLSLLDIYGMTEFLQGGTATCNFIELTKGIINKELCL